MNLRLKISLVSQFMRVRREIYSIYFPQNNIHISAGQLIKKSNVFAKNKFENPYEEMLRKSKKIHPQVTVIDLNSKAKQMTLNEAMKLATREGLKLYEVTDTERNVNGRKVYEMVTGKEYYGRVKQLMAEKKQKTKSKKEKVIELSSNIAPSDLQIKVNKLLKLLREGFNVKIVLTLGEKGTTEKLDNVYSEIESALKEKGTVTSKQTSVRGTTFFVAPILSE